MKKLQVYLLILLLLLLQFQSAQVKFRLVRTGTHDATLRAILRAIAELHRVSTFAILRAMWQE